MTSALSSTVYAIELLELPKVMPIATRSAGTVLGPVAPFSLIWTDLKGGRLGMYAVVECASRGRGVYCLVLSLGKVDVVVEKGLWSVGGVLALSSKSDRKLLDVQNFWRVPWKARAPCSTGQQSSLAWPTRGLLQNHLGTHRWGQRVTPYFIY